MKGIVIWLKAHYDKLVAVMVLIGLLVSLVYLAMMLGNVQQMHAQFDRQIKAVRPENPKASTIDVALFRRASERLVQPPQLEEWTNALCIPEQRVHCVDCRRPIEFAATVCPFCDAPQPKKIGEQEWYDGDDDGLWDSWERKYGLDPQDRDDATKDLDGDGFSNLEEFQVKTNPADPEDHPSIEAKLRVTKVKADPFRLKFKGLVKLPTGDVKFQLNLKGDTRTYFVKLNEEVEGFRLVKYEEKKEKVKIPGVGGEQTVDASVITLKRGDKEIPLKYGEEVPYSEPVADLLFTMDNTKYTNLKVEGEFDLKGKKYRVIKIDKQDDSVVIDRLLDNQSFTIRRGADKKAGENTDGGSKNSPGEGVNPR